MVDWKVVAMEIAVVAGNDTKRAHEFLGAHLARSASRPIRGPAPYTLHKGAEVKRQGTSAAIATKNTPNERTLTATVTSLKTPSRFSGSACQKCAVPPLKPAQSASKKKTGATPLAMVVQGGYSSKHTLVSAPQVYHELQALDEM